MDTSEADLLFQKYSIQELRHVLTKTKGNVEAKKSELKIRVGEKYRDVLQAADSIRSMKDASSQLTLNLQNTIELCRVKNIQDSVVHSTAQNKVKFEFYIAAYIKMLLSTPERIWLALEDKKYLEAAGLYIIAETIVNHTMHPSDSDKIRKSFPIIERQWDVIQHFKSQIAHKALSNLQSENLTPTIACIHILKQSSCKDVLIDFLESKRTSINGIDFKTDLNQGIMDMNQCLFHAVYSVYSIFYPNNSGTNALIQTTSEFMSRLKEMEKNKDQIMNWYSEKSNLETILPFIFPLMRNSNYVIHTESLDISSIQNMAREWLNTLTIELKERVQQELINSCTVLELSSAREQTLISISNLELEKSQDAETWKQVFPFSFYKSIKSKKITKKTIHSSWSFWNDFLLEPFNWCILSKMKTNISEKLNELYQKIELRLDEFAGNPNHPDLDASIWTWKNSKDKCNDAPITREILLNFDDSFQNILADVSSALEYQEYNHLFPKTCTTLSLNVLYDLESNSKFLAKELQGILQSNIKILVDRVIHLMESKVSCVSDLSPNSLVFLARLFYKLSHRIQNYIKTESHELTWTYDKKIQASFLQVYQIGYRLWSQLIIKQFNLSLKTALLSQEWHHDDYFQSLWEKSEIQGSEKDSVESLYLPIHVSHGLLQSLFQLCIQLQNASVFDLDINVLFDICISFGKELVLVFKDLESLGFLGARLCKNGTLQLLFDFTFCIKLIQGLWLGELGIESEKNTLKKTSNAFLNVLKSMIDPIDLAVYEPILSINVDRFYQRHYILLTPLIRFNLKTEKKLGFSNESHHVIPLAPSTTRFTLLPIGVDFVKSKSNLNYTSHLSPRRRASDAKLYPKPIVKINLIPSVSSGPAKNAFQGSVLGLVGMGNTGQARERATELFMNASNFISGVLGSNQPSAPKRK